MKGLIDTVLGWTISKKLTVFAVATFLVLKGNLSGTEWVYISLMYLGTQGAIDLWNSIKK
jgi:hypothetical protein|tara:strand:+ start:8033 stop:8212 length:180 start_codon:yes stop_codon:yes gene_type:complete